MKLNYNTVREHHQWVKENMRDEKNGRIYGAFNIYYEIKADGEYIGDVFEGELKATAEKRRKSGNGMWWAAVKDGKMIGEPVKSRKKAIEILLSIGSES